MEKVFRIANLRKTSTFNYIYFSFFAQIIFRSLEPSFTTLIEKSEKILLEIVKESVECVCGCSC
jgi:hypothetical protein